MDQWIPALRDGDDLVHSDVEGVSGVLSDFYFSLFSAKPCEDATRDTLWSNIVSLPSQQAASCDGYLSVAECFVALQGMARGKAKGIQVWKVSLWSSISTSGVRWVLTWWKC